MSEHGKTERALIEATACFTFTSGEGVFGLFLSGERVVAFYKKKKWGGELYQSVANCARCMCTILFHFVLN